MQSEREEMVEVEISEETFVNAVVQSSSWDWKSWVIVMLVVVILIESLAVLVMAYAVKDDKVKIIEQPAAPRAIPEPEVPNLEERVPGVGNPAEENGGDEVPPPPGPHPVRRITKRLAVTPNGECFHDAECSTIRDTRRILRGCNVCRP